MNLENDHIENVDSTPVCLVGANNFSREVLGNARPVLILCMSKDKSFSAQMSEIEKIQLKYRRFLKICLLDEDFLSVFMERYAVKGMPTFLIFSEGKEQERLLGNVKFEDLTRFFLRVLPGLNDPVT